MWRNVGGTSFVKLAEGVGAVVAADFDNDGYPDLFSWSQIKMYRNEGGHKFVDFPLPSMPPTSSRGACWGDFDNDGFVDLYLGGFEDWDKQITYPSYRIMNKGGKKFNSDGATTNSAPAASLPAISIVTVLSTFMLPITVCNPIGFGSTMAEGNSRMRQKPITHLQLRLALAADIRLVQRGATSTTMANLTSLPETSPTSIVAEINQSLGSSKILAQRMDTSSMT